METMKQSGLWSSLGTHDSVVVIWWLCISSSGETRKFDCWNQIWPWRSSRVGGCERVFTPVRWRQVRLSCIKWRSTFFYIFSCVRSSVGSSSSRWTAVAPTVMLGWRFCPADTRCENNVIMTSVMTLSSHRVPVGLACEAGRSPWCREFWGVTASSVWGRCWWVPGWGSCMRQSWSARFPRFAR